MDWDDEDDDERYKLSKVDKIIQAYIEAYTTYNGLFFNELADQTRNILSPGSFSPLVLAHFIKKVMALPRAQNDEEFDNALYELSKMMGGIGEFLDLALNTKEDQMLLDSNGTVIGKRRA